MNVKWRVIHNMVSTSTDFKIQIKLLACNQEKNAHTHIQTHRPSFNSYCLPKGLKLLLFGVWYCSYKANKLCAKVYYIFTEILICASFALSPFIVQIYMECMAKVHIYLCIILKIIVSFFNHTSNTLTRLTLQKTQINKYQANKAISSWIHNEEKKLHQLSSSLLISSVLFSYSHIHMKYTHKKHIQIKQSNKIWFTHGK